MHDTGLPTVSMKVFSDTCMLCVQELQTVCCICRCRKTLRIQWVTSWLASLVVDVSTVKEIKIAMSKG